MDKIIALSAGHGRYTAGKRCLKSLDPNQTREWVLNDRIADRVEQMLAEYNCQVLRLDDTTGATDVTLLNRVTKANNAKADVYISIHHNAGVNGGAGGGTVVFYYPAGNCKEIATKLYNNIVIETDLIGNRGTPVANGRELYELKKTIMPCFLIENGFMDSQTDVPIILSEQQAEKTAKGIVRFLVEQYSLGPKSCTCVENVQENLRVKITGSVQIRKGPGTNYAVASTITSGVYTIVEKCGVWGRLKSGAGWIDVSSSYCSAL